MSARAFREADGTAAIEHLHVARSAGERMLGLLGRDGLGDSEGMWFPDCRLIHTCGMRFAIDLVYLDGKGEVRKVVKNLRPWRLSACLGADSVIELKSGAAERLGLARGVKIRIVE